MSFDVRITLTGLCFFLTRDNSELWILMPATPPGIMNGHDHDHGGGPRPRASAANTHVARLMYDRGYENAGPGRKLIRDIACVNLDRRELILGSANWWNGAAPTPLSRELTDEIIDLDREHDKVDVRVLEAAPPLDKLSARLKLEAGCLCDYAPGITWKVGTSAKTTRLTYRAEWVIRDIPGTSLPELMLTSLDGSPNDRVPALYPIGDTIRLDIVHLPPKQLPNNRVNAANADGRHLHYYELLSQNYQARKIPVKGEDGTLFTTGCEPEPLPEAAFTLAGTFGAIPLECMFGGGTLP